MGVVEDIAFLPILDPVADLEGFHLSVGSGTDDADEAGVDQHLFTDKTGEGVYRLELSRSAAVNVHVASEEADSGPGSVDDRILFGVDASAEFIALAVGNIQLVPEAEAVFEAVFRFPWRSDVSGGDDLVVADDNRADRAAKTGASSGDFCGNSQIILVF